MLLFYETFLYLKALNVIVIHLEVPHKVLVGEFKGSRHKYKVTQDTQESQPEWKLVSKNNWKGYFKNK